MVDHSEFSFLSIRFPAQQPSRSSRSENIPHRILPCIEKRGISENYFVVRDQLEIEMAIFIGIFVAYVDIVEEHGHISVQGNFTVEHFLLITSNILVDNRLENSIGTILEVDNEHSKVCISHNNLLSFQLPHS